MKITIKRLTEVNDTIITQINSLMDEGTVWDVFQGKKFLNNVDNILMVAYDNETIVGFLSGHRLQRFDKRKAEVLLYEIGVHLDHRNLGVGKALTKELINWAKEIEADQIWVLTNKSNTAAVALYESVGGIIENTDEQMYTIKV